MRSNLIISPNTADITNKMTIAFVVNIYEVPNILPLRIYRVNGVDNY